MLVPMKNLIILLTICVLSSCSSKYIPPSRPLDQIQNSKGQSETEEIALLISNLKNEKFDQCGELRNLLTNTKHPLTPWLIANDILHCDVSQKDINIYASVIKLAPKWSREILADAILKKSNNHDDLISAVLIKVDFLKTQNDKIIFLKTYIDKLKSVALTNKLFEVAPRFVDELNTSIILKSAKDFERNREFNKARELYSKIIRSKEFDLNLKIQAFDNLRLSYNIERKKDAYLLHTQKFIKFLSKNRNIPIAQDKYFEVSLAKSRIFWTLDRFREAKATLRSLLKDGAINQKNKAFIYFYMGGIYEDENNVKRAIENYTQAYIDFSSLPDTDITENMNDALWNICWYLYKEGKFEDSLSWLEKYKPTKDSTDHKFSFWRAIVLKKLERTDDYEDAISELRKNDEYGFYGQMSYLDSEEGLSPIEPLKDEFEYAANPLSWAIYLNDEELAHSILDSNPNSTLKEYYVSKYYHKMIFKYFGMAPSEREKFDALMFSYPLAFKDKFISANKSTIVRPSLLMSIARQESAFNPYARSHAHAFGLLQLIPAQGQRLAKKLKIPYTDYNDLYDVEKNISLSSKLLEELIHKLKNNFVNFVASYNAGESKVIKWRQRNPKLNELEFIEQIPYKETRNYVKLVARNYLIYARQLSKENIKLTNKFFSFEEP